MAYIYVHEDRGIHLPKTLEQVPFPLASFPTSSPFPFYPLLPCLPLEVGPIKSS